MVTTFALLAGVGFLVMILNIYAASNSPVPIISVVMVFISGALMVVGVLGLVWEFVERFLI